MLEDLGLWGGFKLVAFVPTQSPGLPRSGGYLGRVEIGLATATLLRQSRNLIRVKQIGGRKNVCSLGS